MNDSQIQMNTNKKILVTGGAGFIGSHVVELLASENFDIVVFDNLSTGNFKKIENFPVTFIEGDIRNLESLTKAFKNVDTVFHLAAAISVPESMEKPKEYVDININGTLNVIEAAKKCGVRRVVFSSSAAVYGDEPTLPKTETMRPCLLSPYASTKLDGEIYLEMYKSKTFSAVSLRYFNVFGPRQDADSPYAAAIPKFINQALKNEDIGIFGDGTQTRDFIYVKDVAKANLHAATIEPGLYNVCTGLPTVIAPLAEKIIELTKAKSTINILPERPGDIKHSLGSMEKIKSTGWQPESPFEKSLQETIEYYSKLLPHK